MGGEGRNKIGCLEGFSEKVAFEARLKGGKGGNQEKMGGGGRMAFQAEGTAIEKGLSQHRASELTVKLLP